MLAMPDIFLPVLERIVEAPVFGPDGTIETTPGYHAGSRTYYAGQARDCDRSEPCQAPAEPRRRSRS